MSIDLYVFAKMIREKFYAILSGSQTCKYLRRQCESNHASSLGTNTGETWFVRSLNIETCPSKIYTVMSVHALPAEHVKFTRVTNTFYRARAF